MYVHPCNQQNDEQRIRTIIEEYGFALLVSQVDGLPWATHLPLLLDKDERGEDILLGHFAKANLASQQINDGELVLAVFSGAHTYISSSWYDHLNVPTWNYEAVHVYGSFYFVHSQEKIRYALKKLIDKYEKNMEHPLSLDKMPEEFLGQEMRGLVAFEIKIREVHASRKLSQNRNDANFVRIVAQLERQENENAQKIAAEMRKDRPHLWNNHR